MNHPREHLLAHAGLAEDEDGDSGACELVDQAFEVSERAVAHHSLRIRSGSGVLARSRQERLRRPAVERVGRDSHVRPRMDPL